MTTHSGILAWRNPHGQSSLVGFSPWGHKELDTSEHTNIKLFAKCLLPIKS